MLGTGTLCLELREGSHSIEERLQADPFSTHSIGSHETICGNIRHCLIKISQTEVHISDYLMLSFEKWVLNVTDIDCITLSDTEELDIKQDLGEAAFQVSLSLLAITAEKRSKGNMKRTGNEQEPFSAISAVDRLQTCNSLFCGYHPSQFAWHSAVTNSTAGRTAPKHWLEKAWHAPRLPRSRNRFPGSAPDALSDQLRSHGISKEEGEVSVETRRSCKPSSSEVSTEMKRVPQKSEAGERNVLKSVRLSQRSADKRSF
ncbi:hypothetical protein NDU88_010689 [Pleurodeles waltl]|uniref:Uncharacterized protein n=1 Tax=Pleurodeles waltl TaxID=8319 RepID=A0AAV7S400_PLEWA|nr:hypothetical protein NDU88_010689 [Pleurodeles waltl]